MRNILFALAAITAITGPASAASFIVNYDNNFGISDNNDFKSQLNGLGLYKLSNKALLTLNGSARVSFDYMGSESGYVDSFHAGAINSSENNKGWGAVSMGPDQIFGAGLQNWNFTNNSNSELASPGTLGFSIFLPKDFGKSGKYKSNVLYLGYDDETRNRDSDYDDFTVRATISGGVPEPAAWAMMITGFGLAGTAIRRSKSRTLIAA